jgi:hypothetical protein
MRWSDMTDAPRRYLITAYSEWEALNVEAECPDDQRAIDKARRYGSLRHVGTNLPSVIFAHIVADEPDGPREVGTWEYRLRHTTKPGFLWHAGPWSDRPKPDDRPAIRLWAADFANGS